MTKNEFLGELSMLLSQLTTKERQKAISFYQELLDDYIESGLSEEDAVAQLEDVRVISEKILHEAGAEPSSPKKKKTWMVTVLISTCIIWAPLVIALAITGFSLYISLWAVLVSLFASAIGFIVCLPFACITAFFLLSTNVPASIFQFGCGLMLCGFGIFLGIGTLKLSRLMLSFTKWMSQKISNLFGKVGGAK